MRANDEVRQDAARFGIALLAPPSRFEAIVMISVNGCGQRPLQYPGKYLRALWLVCASKVYSGLGADLVCGIISLSDHYTQRPIGNSFSLIPLCRSMIRDIPGAGDAYAMDVVAGS